MIKNSLSNSFCFISEDISKLVFRNDAFDMPPVFSMFGSIAKFKAIRFQITRLFGALKQILPLHPNRSTCNLIVDLAPPPKLGLELLVRLGLSCQAAFQGLQPNYSFPFTIFIHLSIYLSIHPPFHPSIYPSTIVSVSPATELFHSINCKQI